MAFKVYLNTSATKELVNIGRINPMICTDKDGKKKAA